MTDSTRQANIKKDFSKVIGTIRKEIRAEQNSNTEFPKAMLTGQQAKNSTATVNCGGEWTTLERSAERANRVMHDPRFQQFLKKYNAIAYIEQNPYRTLQIRIDYI